MVRQPFDCNALSDWKRPEFKPRATTIKNPETRRGRERRSPRRYDRLYLPRLLERKSWKRGHEEFLAESPPMGWGFCLADALSWCRQF